TSAGEIRNLFHFTNLARTDWEEAKEIFYSGSLKRILTGNDDRFMAAYRVLSTGEKTDEGLDQFLIYCGKKSPAVYSPDQDLFVVNDPLNDTRRSVRIMRDGWGYANLTFNTDSGFIRLEKKTVTENDFLGNEFDLGFFVESDSLHGGLNIAEITCTYGHVVKKIHVNVYSGAVDRASSSLRRKIESLRLSISDFYINYRLGRISSKTWAIENDRIADEFIAISRDDPEPRLLKAYVLLVEKRKEEASWVLKQAGPLVDADRRLFLSAIHLSMSASASENPANEEVLEEKLKDLYAMDPSDWRTGLVLIQRSFELIGSPEKRFLFMREMYDRGCRSPLLYCEAYLTIKAAPAVLNELGDFELHVISFIQKRSLMDRDYKRLLVDFVRRYKEYKPYSLKLLKKCYQDDPDDETLYLICTQLMKGKITDGDSFKWYETGVRQDIRITGLFDHYMRSLDLTAKVDIPENVITYYSYECTLPDEITAFLYRYVCSHGSDHPELYARYRLRAREFAIGKIEEKIISRDLAWLYSNVVDVNELNEFQATCFASLLFSEIVTTENSDMKRVCSATTFAEIMSTGEFSGDTAYISIYMPNSCLALEDDLGRRWVADVSFQREKLMDPGSVATTFLEKITDDKMLDLYLAEGGQEYTNIRRKNYRRYMRIAGDSDFSLRLRRDITHRLIRYLDSRGDSEVLEPFLTTIIPEMVPEQEVAGVISIMIKRRMYNKALEWIREFGCSNFSGEDLLALSRAVILGNINTVPESELLYIMLEALRLGHFDQLTVGELMIKFKGTLRMLSDIWKAALSLGMERTVMDERIINQTLCTGAYLADFWEICKDYISLGSVDEDLVTAVVMQESYEYFTKGNKCDRFLFSMTTWLLSRKRTLHRVCGLAYVQYFSEHPGEITSDVNETLVDFLKQQDSEGTVLDCYREFTELDPVMLPFRDRTVISYRTAPGRKVMIHYVFENEGSTSPEEYRTEEMYEEFEGYYVKMFILFFGEKIQYYITESGNEDVLTMNGTVTSLDPVDENGSRYELLDNICTGVSLHDYEGAGEKLDEYLKSSFVADRLFGT
ncbi:MAG: DUF5717 family protein, partial [Lachnospiraceae bacterium]|nr:DUF5717 family protein [Lachnospiraceae bacterium]